MRKESCLRKILKGLKVDDPLVVVGQRNLIEGQEVSIAADLTDLDELRSIDGH